MTPKQKYMERRRLKAERLLREEEARNDYHQHNTLMEERMIRLMDSFERIADVMELWADKQS